MELVVVEKNGQARRKPMTINFEHIGFTADAKHIVSSYGIFDLNLNIIEFPDRFKHNFLAVRGTHNGIEFNKDTLIMWRVPNVVERERVVLHDSIASVQSDTASRLLLVTFANGTVELFRMSDMFTNFDPILPREEQEESPTDTVETNAISEIRIYDILGNRIVEGAKPLSGIYLIVTITDEGITSEKVWLN